MLKDSYNVVQRIDLPGHRGDVRALATASDDTLLLSAASGAVKVWNPANGACLGTMESGYGLCAVFAPDNRHAVVGTKVRGWYDECSSCWCMAAVCDCFQAAMNSLLIC